MLKGTVQVNVPEFPRPEMTTLRRQLDEQLVESLSQCPSAARFAARETWGDMIMQVLGTSMRGMCSQLLPRVCCEWSRRTTTVRVQLARVLANIDDEFEISRRQEPTRMTRQNRKTLLHRSLTTSVLAGCDTRTLRVWCPRAAAPGSAMSKAGKTPLVRGPVNQ